MTDPRLEKWEKRLKAVFNGIDEYLEKKYGGRYPLHPSRAPNGTTGNAAYDGLFDVGAAFSAGLGSEHGAGYVVEVRMATLSSVPPELLREIGEEVAERLRAELPRAFPGRDLVVERDGNVYKICGDLGLDEV